MKNQIQVGDVLDLVAPSGGVTAGVGFLVGGIFAVASVTALAGAVVAAAVEGVFELAANSTDTANPGDPAYWDDTNKRVTTSATGNRFVGVFTEAKANPASVGRVNIESAHFAPSAAITASVTTGATNSSPYGFTTAAQADGLVTRVNSIITALGKAGIIVPN